MSPFKIRLKCGIDLFSSGRADDHMEKVSNGSLRVSQRLFANWEPDRTGSSATQRVVAFDVTRLFLGFQTQPGSSLVLTAKLQGNKRNIRSNDITVTLGGPTVDVDINIQFTIQYPHYIKHKANVLQILIQRKRKYKNRPLPGGFKTLAIGTVNLSQLMQTGRLREILLFNTEDIEKNLTNVTSIGRLTLSSCQCTPLEIEESKLGKKMMIAEVDEDDEDSESEYDDVVDDVAEQGAEVAPSSSREYPTNMKHKMMRRNNIKQRFAKLLGKFRIAEEETAEGIPSRTGSVLGTPTAQELEALFEELEEMSDSDPGEWHDDISIRSNPRPALRPYFTRSKEILPAIFDQEPLTDTDNDPTDVELSSDDKEIAARVANSRLGPIDVPNAITNPRSQNKVVNTTSVPLTSHSGTQGVPHSQTTGSIYKKAESKPLETFKQLNIQEELPKFLGDTTRLVRVWLCMPEASYLTTLDLPIVFCTSIAVAKTALNQVVTRIQNFCNTNSENPPVYLIGIIGGDKIINHVARAYVEIFNMKSSSPCLPFIRFVIVPPPQALISHLLEDAGPLPEELCRDIWEKWTELKEEDQMKITTRLEAYASQANGCLQIPFGEVLLQSTEGNESGQSFIPFLTEVRMGQNDDEFESSSPRLEEFDRSRDFTGGNSSPPCSPHIKGDACDLNLEYWLAGDPTLELSKKDKGSLKTTFRSVLIARMWNQPQLYLNFVKEKRKEKMLQKLGMKKGQKSDIECTPVHVTNVSRLICSGSGKNNDLTVTIDGNQYRNVRYFQTTAQWQTHIKTFPIAAPIATSGLSYM